MRSRSPGCSQRRDASRSRRCPCAWSRTITNRVVNADALMGAGLPEWWGARHSRRMYNATTSTFASYPDPEGRLHGPRQPAAPAPRPCSRAGVRRPWRLPPSAPSSGSVPRSWPASLAPPPPQWSAACWTQQASPRRPPGDRRPPAARHHRPAAHHQGGGTRLRLPAGIPCRPGGDAAMPATSIASELGVHPATVRDRLDQHQLPRSRATCRPYQAIQRQTECWRPNARPAWPAWGSPVWRSICGCGGSGRAGRFGACSPSCGSARPG
jgi:hypothetical protein